MRDRPPHDEDRDDDEGRRLSQRRQMLGLPVTVCVAGIRRASGDTNREERQQRRDQVDSGVRRLREQPETVRGDPCGDLERDQRAGREHGDESGSALRGHTLSIPKKKSPPWRALLAGGCAATYASVSPHDAGADRMAIRRRIRGAVPRGWDRPARKVLAIPSISYAGFTARAPFGQKCARTA